MTDQNIKRIMDNIERNTRPKKQKPCKFHTLAFGSKDVSEATHIPTRRCLFCGWYIKTKREPLDR